MYSTSREEGMMAKCLTKKSFGKKNTFELTAKMMTIIAGYHIFTLLVHKKQ